MRKPWWKDRHYWIGGGIGALVVLLTGWWGLSRARSMHSMTYRVPEAGVVFQVLPAVDVKGETFRGIWSDLDRGAWVFDYPTHEPSRLREALEKQLSEAGWELQWPGREGKHWWRNRSEGFSGLRVGVAERPGAVRVVVYVTRAKRGEEDEERYYRQMVRRFWEE